MIDLSGKAGGPCGIGGVVSLELAGCGADVAINYKSGATECLREISFGAKSAAGSYSLCQAASYCHPWSPLEFRVGYTIDISLA